MIQKAERIIEAYQKVKPAGCGVIGHGGPSGGRKNYLGRGTGCDSGRAPWYTWNDFFLPGEAENAGTAGSSGRKCPRRALCGGGAALSAAGRGFPGYRRFDCHRMDYNGWVEIPTVPVIIVEGAYSQHPRFGGYADLTVFCDIAPGRTKAAHYRPQWGRALDGISGAMDSAGGKVPGRVPYQSKMPC